MPVSWQAWDVGGGSDVLRYIASLKGIGITVSAKKTNAETGFSS